MESDFSEGPPRMQMTTKEALVFAKNKENEFEWKEIQLKNIKNDLLSESDRMNLPLLKGELQILFSRPNYALSKLINVGQKHGVIIDLNALDMNTLEAFCKAHHIELIP